MLQIDGYYRVAKVRTQETAWKLIEYLRPELPDRFTYFVLLSEPTGACEVRVNGMMYPVNEVKIREMLAEFVKKHRP